MKFLNRIEAANRMNQLGAEGRPFLFAVDYKQDNIWLEETGNVKLSEVLYDFQGYTNAEKQEHFPDKKIEWEPFPPAFDDYAKAFRKVVGEIRAGNSYLVNLTCQTPVCTNLTLSDVFYQSTARYKLWMKDRFVVFSPEIFVRMEQGYVYSYPMKGTIDASLPDARGRILADPKEAAEHATIVDLIRNDLSMIASEVTVVRYRYMDELPTNKGSLLQVSSEISGRLSDDWKAHIGENLFRLLPAGSITGAPKKKTRQIIAEAEGYPRGFYTGVMGYFDGERLDSAVMIRFLEQQDGLLFFKSGGGITSRSDLQSEYNEMKQKVYVPIY